MWPTAIPQKYFDTNTLTLCTKTTVDNFTAVSRRNMVRQRKFSLLERRFWKLASGGCARSGECQLPRTQKHPHISRAWCVRNRECQDTTNKEVPCQDSRNAFHPRWNENVGRWKVLSALTCSEALPRQQKTAVSSLSTRAPSGSRGKRRQRRRFYQTELFYQRTIWDAARQVMWTIRESDPMLLIFECEAPSKRSQISCGAY